MLLFSTYALIVFILLLLNSIPVLGSSRTRRFAKIPSWFFFLLFITFAILRLVGFLSPDMSEKQLKQEDSSYRIVKKTSGKVFTRPNSKKEKITYESLNEVFSEQKKFYENSKIALKFALVQALFVIVLSFLGKNKFVHRSDYYTRKIKFFLFYFVFCLLFDLFIV